MHSDDEVEPLDLRVMGVVVRLVVLDPPTRARLAHQWSRTVDTCHHDEPVKTIHVLPARPGGEAPSDYSLTTQVTLAALQATRGRRVNLHAGGLADETGRVLALVAASGTGKTTATRLLATRLGYLSDETVSIDPSGVVSPHAKPLSVVVDPERPFDKHQVSPDDIGLLPTPESGRLARLVVLDRGTDVERGLRRLGLAKGLLTLIEQSSSLAHLPTPLRTLLDLVDECGGVWAIGYVEFEDHLDEVAAHLARDLDPLPATPEPVWHPGRVSFPLSEGDGEHLARLPWVEAVQLGDDLVVLTESAASLLGGLTATVWHALAEPHTMDQLVDAARDLHGEHPDATVLVEQAVASLEDLTLVARGTLA